MRRGLSSLDHSKPEAGAWTKTTYKYLDVIDVLIVGILDATPAQGYFRPQKSATVRNRWTRKFPCRLEDLSGRGRGRKNQ